MKYAEIFCKHIPCLETLSKQKLVRFLGGFFLQEIKCQNQTKHSPVALHFK